MDPDLKKLMADVEDTKTQSGEDTSKSQGASGVVQCEDENAKKMTNTDGGDTVAQKVPCSAMDNCKLCYYKMNSQCIKCSLCKSTEKGCALAGSRCGNFSRRHCN